MTLATRTAIAIAVGLASATLHAQSSPGNGTTFRSLSFGEQQQQRTAQLLAAAQQGQQPASPFSGKASTSGLGGSFLTTRQTQNPGPTLGAAQGDVYSNTPPPYAVASTAAMPAASYDAGYASGAGVVSGTGMIPAMPDARPGECFALIRIPEQFRSYEQEYEARAASERIETTPPRYEMVTEQYVAQEAFERLEVVPASFRTVTEQVEVAAPSSRYVSTEPVYETVTERVLEQPARSVWKRGNGPIQRIDNATGEIMCLVEEPAIYKTISRRVLRTPAEVREVPVPGQYSTVSKRVMERPAEVRRVVVPEQLATRTVRRLAEPGGVRRIPIPAQNATRTVRELVSPARLEWRSVLCQTNMTTENIRRVQEALQREGFSTPVSGRLDSQTIAALNAYQRARNLPQDQYLNMDTVRALGVM